jgi:hypothetical protein
LLFLQGQNLIIGNLGDSRAVLGTRDEHNHLVALQLTVDLKPSIPSMFRLHVLFYSRSLIYDDRFLLCSLLFIAMQFVTNGSCIYIVFYSMLL